MISYQENRKLSKEEPTSDWRMATVEQMEGEKVRLRFDGEETASTKKYMKIYGAVVETGDRVLCVRCAGTYVVIGAIRG